MKSAGFASLVVFFAPILASIPLHAEEVSEPRLGELRQLTFGGENAEAYWSPDGSELIFQGRSDVTQCDQIYRLPLFDRSAGGDGSGDANGMGSGDGEVSVAEPILVSNGSGRTTCAYFTYPEGDHILYASTHGGSAECPAPPSRAEGYVWPIYSDYDIYRARPDGSEAERLTETPGYDAEATVCPVDGSIVFTSVRDGDLDLYRMAADGSQVQRLTTEPGYDGGAFFSADCTKIVWRASRPANDQELADYRGLLEKSLVRPGKLELWVANADGSQARQITSLGAASFAPYFFPDGRRVIFSSNYGDPKGREFDLWAVDIDGGRLERITNTPEFDGFPVFSPDGKMVVFGSNRNHAEAGDTNLFLARWKDDEEVADAVSYVDRPVDRFLEDVRWLSDDAREGRGLRQAGLGEAGQWIEQRFRSLRLEPAGVNGTYRHPISVVVGAEPVAAPIFTADGVEVSAEEFLVAPYSGDGRVEASVIGAGYGIHAPELGWDDYEGLDVEGRVVAIRRFVPLGGPFESHLAASMHSNLLRKIQAAEERGAVGVILILEESDVPHAVQRVGAYRRLGFSPAMLDSDVAKIPVVTTKSTAIAGWAESGDEHRALIQIEQKLEVAELFNVLAKLPANAASRLPGVIVVGAHYDHLGLSRPDPQGKRHLMNGADDNASGVAALFESARQLAEVEERGRDVYFAAWSAEEVGTLGSRAFVEQRLPGLEAGGGVFGMINLDMVGRLRDNFLRLSGTDSATRWPGLVGPLCEAAGFDCQIGGSGSGPSDHRTFYHAGIPVLYVLTGFHPEYHSPRDDAHLIYGDGAIRVATWLSQVIVGLGREQDPLGFQRHGFELMAGDLRPYRSYLGSIPDAESSEGLEDTGLTVAGVRPESPAQKAGLRPGDVVVAIDDHPIRTAKDLTFLLRRLDPGTKVQAEVLRDGERVKLQVVLAPLPRRR